MAHLLAWTRLEPSALKGAIVPDSAIAVEGRYGGGLITGFRGATGTAGIVFLLLAAIVWLALPFGHPVYAVVIPPFVLAGIVYAFIRAREPRHPSLKDGGTD